MSWFDTAGFATLAKSALKEAQKTIDKALDIQDEDPKGKTNSGSESQSKTTSESIGGQPKRATPPRSLSLDLGSTMTHASREKPQPVLAAQKSAEESPPNDVPDGEQIREEIKNYPHVEVVMRRKEPKNPTNRAVLRDRSGLSRDQLANTSQELERSKKAMSAKEEMERSHIEAVHNLTKQVATLEKELAQSKNNVSSLTSSLVSVQKYAKKKNKKN
ncbi:unnamed protein product [Nesidiocoris tenuis]|uniref:Uncharacterized protein n=1 Tax=Nesidiocoris tenuis TaxID=355587 RepID=A0A6H5GSX3_9HEMI|nr:unnamed protein product [Nesidiocoris tenuis]